MTAAVGTATKQPINRKSIRAASACTCNNSFINMLVCCHMLIELLSIAIKQTNAHSATNDAHQLDA